MIKLIPTESTERNFAVGMHLQHINFGDYIIANIICSDKVWRCCLVSMEDGTSYHIPADVVDKSDITWKEMKALMCNQQRSWYVLIDGKKFNFNVD